MEKMSGSLLLSSCPGNFSTFVSKYIDMLHTGFLIGFGSTYVCTQPDRLCSMAQFSQIGSILFFVQRFQMSYDPISTVGFVKYPITQVDSISIYVKEALLHIVRPLDASTGKGRTIDFGSRMISPALWLCARPCWRRPASCLRGSAHGSTSARPPVDDKINR
jgi:hypothetical protein